MTKPRLTLLLVLTLLASCAQQPAGPGTAGSPAPPPGPASPPAPAAAAAPAPEAAPSPAQTAAQRQQAQTIALAAALQLEKGEEEGAKAELNRALALDPGNKLALTLLKQINEDPVALLGKESFAYTVKSTDSMSTIAGRFLGDVYLFYALARYNRIAVPRQLAAGQTLRVPGKAPPPAPPAPPAPAPVAATPAPAPTPAPTPAPASPPPPPAPAPPSAGEQALRAGEAAERAKDLEKALVQYRKAASLDQAGAQAKADKVAQQLVARYTSAAQRAFAAQDLKGAIDGWTQVLRIEPGNERAQQELKRCRELKARADKLPN